MPAPPQPSESCPEPTAQTVFLALPGEEDTNRLGRLLAASLGAGDTLLLHGTIGAGKSHLARALIRAALGRMEDVPSPTFTLVQTYEAPGLEIWHADLYRLTHPDEVWELGLDQAFGRSLCLIEWPDRLGTNLPPTAIHLHLSVVGPGRVARIDAPAHPRLITALKAAE